MLSSLDILYIVLAICSVIITVVLVFLGMEWLRTLRDIRRIAQNVEQISAMLERVSHAVFPGIARVAKKADKMEQKVSSFLEKKVEEITKEF